MPQPTTARLDLSVWRNDDVWEFPLRIVGLDATDIPLAMQVRLAPDTPGAPLIDLGKVLIGSVEGLQVVGVSVLDGITVSEVRIRINRSTRQALPYAGELGSATPLTYALLIDGKTRLVGSFNVLAHSFGSDNAPASRPIGFAATSAATSPASGATLTISAEGGATLMIDGSDLLGAEVARAREAAEQSSDTLTAALSLMRMLGPPITPQGRWSYTAGPARQILLSTIRPGSAARFSCSGGAAYNLRYFPHPATSAAPIFAVYRDGVAAGQVALTGAANALSSVEIASGLDPAATYNFELRLRGVAETDPRWPLGAGPRLLDITGGICSPWEDARRRDLWIGDSITAAVSALAPGSAPTAHAGDLCYGRLVSEMSGHAPTINGFGGASLTGSGIGSGGVPAYWNGRRTDTPGFYHKQSLPVEAEQYDRIFINLGTNDNGAGVSDDAFTAAMVGFCQAQRRDHPEATIWVIRPFGGFKARAALRAALMAGVKWIDTFGLELTTTDGIHPDVAGHAKAAQYIYDWLTNPRVLRNGDFSSSDVSMWLPVVFGGFTPSMAVANGRGQMTGLSRHVQGFTTEIGQTYRLRLKRGGTDPYVQKADDPDAEVGMVQFGFAGGSLDVTFVATSEFTYIVLTTFTDGWYDDITVTKGPKPFLNGDFSDPDLSMWPYSGDPGFTAGLTIVDGHGTMTGQKQHSQGFTTVPGQTYSIHFERGGTDPYVQVASTPNANPDIKKWDPGVASVTDSFVATGPMTYVVLSTFTDGWYDNITIR